MVLRKIEYIFSKIPILRENSLRTNLLIFLFSISYVIIAIDLQTEMAVEKDEIFSVFEVLDDTSDSPDYNVETISNSELKLIGFITVTTNHIINEDVFTCIKDRSPPCNS
jgi:hypothetical protein